MRKDPDLRIRHGACLPHWEKEGATYAVRFRLIDSLPQGKLAALREEREEATKKLQNSGQKFTRADHERLEYLFSQKIEKFLDADYGACWMKDDEIAKIIAETLQYFHGDRYRNIAWCIMPNHVHVITQPIGEYSLRDITYSWKKFSAAAANEILGRKGHFWQSESFDHLIRNQESLERMVEYVWRNPEEAGLKNWKWRWRIDGNSR